MSVPDTSSDFSPQTICGYPIRPIESVWLCSLPPKKKSADDPCYCIHSHGQPAILAAGTICDDDLSEMLHWSASRYDFLGGPRSRNFSFHPLPSGRYCLSYSFWSHDHSSALRYRRPEKIAQSQCTLTSYSSQRPLASQIAAVCRKNLFPEETYGLYTHCLMVDQETLGCFSNHPFILFEAIRRDRIGCETPTNGHVAARVLSADSTIRALVHSLSQFRQSPVDFESFLFTAQREDSVVVYGRDNLMNWFSGLFNQIAPAQRLDYSFCTALPFSAERPFRITGIGKSRLEWNRLKRDYGQIPRWNASFNHNQKAPPVSSDPDLINLWRYLKESFWGDRKKFLQGIQLWKDYCQRNSALVDSARESLLEWSINVYQGLQTMQLKEPKQMDAMMDMIDVLLK